MLHEDSFKVPFLNQLEPWINMDATQKVAYWIAFLKKLGLPIQWELEHIHQAQRLLSIQQRGKKRREKNEDTGNKVSSIEFCNFPP